jgi:hypothetical protein
VLGASERSNWLYFVQLRILNCFSVCGYAQVQTMSSAAASTLRAEERQELQNLVQTSGLSLDPALSSIAIELIGLGAQPKHIADLLRAVVGGPRPLAAKASSVSNQIRAPLAAGAPGRL